MGNVQKLKLISPIATITIVLFVAVLLLVMTGTGSTFAFVVEGKECGLVVSAADGFTDVGNLNPGDTKSSYLIASNTGAGPLTYFFNIKKTGSNAGSYKGQDGKHLDEILHFTVQRGEETLFDGLIEDFEELALGQMAVGEEQQLDITVHFPGEAGNEYQGSDVTARFKFRAVCGSGGGDDEPPGGDEEPPGGDDDEPPSGGGDEPGEPTEPGDDDEGPGTGDEELEESPDTPEVGPGTPEAPETDYVIEPEQPEVSPTEPGELEIYPEEPEISPEGELEIHPGLPKTGEFSRPAIYAIGLLIILAGLLLRKRASFRK
jgi:LPXTG-motif cell wall-anchored protein